MTDILINASRIKYDILSEMFEKHPINENYVNLYVDFHSILYRLYKSEFGPDIINDPTLVKSLVVSILNTIGHYRRFFATKLKKSNRIFIIFNNKIPDYQSKQIEYGRQYYDKYSYANMKFASMNKAINEAIGFIKEIVNYFEDIYYIDLSRVEEMDVISYLMDKYDGHHIIMTKNELNYQLLNKKENVSVIYPSRDNSVIFSKNGLFNFILHDKKFRPKKVKSELFTIYLTMIGLSKRDVSSITIRGSVKLLKSMDLMIENGMIDNSVSIRQFINELSKVISIDDSDKEMIYSRYRAISSNLSYLSLSDTKKMAIDSCLINLYDQNSLVELNDTLGDKFILNISDLNKNKRVGKVVW